MFLFCFVAHDNAEKEIEQLQLLSRIYKTSKERFRLIKNCIIEIEKTHKKRNALIWISLVLHFFLPKCDEAVINIKHLIKCPWSVHRETLNISLPLLKGNNFQPDNPLNLRDLLRWQESKFFIIPNKKFDLTMKAF